MVLKYVCTKMWRVINVASLDSHNILLQTGTLYHIINCVYADNARHCSVPKHSRRYAMLSAIIILCTYVVGLCESNSKPSPRERLSRSVCACAVGGQRERGRKWRDGERKKNPIRKNPPPETHFPDPYTSYIIELIARLYVVYVLQCVVLCRR